MENQSNTDLPRRPYKDGLSLSVIGFGGIILCSEDQVTGNRYVAEAVERGVNYFDVAPSYFEGEAERKLGPALESHRRRCFLACKTGKRDAPGARAELEESLRRLKTDYFDLYQFHAVTTAEDVAQILGPKGAAETFFKAREEGLVRYLGFSAHSTEAALALFDAFPWDSVLFPLNFVMVREGGFGPAVLEKARAAGAACLALKAMAYTPWAEGEHRGYAKAWYKPAENAQLRALALRYTLGMDVAAAIPPGHWDLFQEALDVASDLRPLTADEEQHLADAAAGREPLFRYRP